MDRSEYFARIHAKTASLFEMASRGPALLAEADEETAAALECYGREMGLAFQIMDDVLDFVGEQERMGKPIGSDLQHGLITLPSLIYLEMHPEDPDLRSVRKDDRIDESSLARLVAAIRDSGAAQKAQEEARQLAASAISRLEIFPPSDARDALRELTNYVTLRSL
jgi:geranylgeranyl pyrophosphate synthase